MTESFASSTGAVAGGKHRRWLTPGRLCGCLAMAVAALVATGQSPDLTAWENFRSLWQAGEGPATQLMHYAWWPRFFVAVLAGAGLAVAGVLMQQVLRNPLAAPTTLGVATGANVAMALALVFAPAVMAWGREWVAMAGGAAAMGVVFMLAWRRQLAPTVVVLAGLVVNLYLSAVATVLLILNPETLTGLLVWGAGSLTQNSWDGVTFLWPRLLAGGVVAILLLRPLALLELDDANARSLGVSLRNLRLGSLGIAVFLTAVVVSAVGVVGFIGLAAPAIVRILGARKVGSRLGWGALLGALLLLLTDLLVQRVPGIFATLLPTGATTAVLGAPLLLWLIPRLRLGGDKPHEHAMPGRRHHRPARLLIMLTMLCCGSLLLALMVGQGMTGWHWLASMDVLEWRLPRTLAAGGAGIMLAIAGTILQRITGNPMASPEVLGISGGTAMGFIGAIYLLPGTTSTLTMIGIGTVSAMVTVGVVVLLNHRSGFVPERVLLTGVAITALFEAVKTFVLSGGDPRGREVIAWMSGSTYFVELWTAVAAIILAGVLLIVTRPFARWLDMLPLGAATAGSLGVAVPRGRLILLGLAALMTAAATLIVGPLSFVGLLAPHLARMIGLHHARIHMLGAGLCGAALMMLADWAGRQVLFPEEIPAGIMASLVGGAYFMWGLRRL